MVKNYKIYQINKGRDELERINIFQKKKKKYFNKLVRIKFNEKKDTLFSGH